MNCQQRAAGAAGLATGPLPVIAATQAIAAELHGQRRGGAWCARQYRTLR
jgi:hypothetical protein